MIINAQLIQENRWKQWGAKQRVRKYEEEPNGAKGNNWNKLEGISNRGDDTEKCISELENRVKNYSS